MLREPWGDEGLALDFRTRSGEDVSIRNGVNTGRVDEGDAFDCTTGRLGLGAMIWMGAVATDDVGWE